MSDHIYRESHFLLLSVCMGVVIALFYDCLRIWRRVVVHGSFWTAMEDLVYWIIVSVMVFGMLYYENNGTFRASVRSIGDIDVSRVAATFGGGGHKRAAGCTIEAQNIEDAERKLLTAIRSYLKTI